MTQKPEIFVCTNLRLSGASCAGRGGYDVLKALRMDDAVKNGDVSVRESVCMGYCTKGPNAKIMGGTFHHALALEDAAMLVAEAKALGEDPSDT